MICRKTPKGAGGGEPVGGQEEGAARVNTLLANESLLVHYVTLRGSEEEPE